MFGSAFTSMAKIWLAGNTCVQQWSSYYWTSYPTLEKNLLHGLHGHDKMSIICRKYMWHFSSKTVVVKYSEIVAYQGFFLIYGKTWTLSLFIKKVISNLSTITNIVLSGPLVQTFFKGWYIKCIWIFCTKWSILNPYQSSFRPPDSGISQLLLIT